MTYADYLVKNWTGNQYPITQMPGAAHPNTRKFYSQHLGYDYATPQGTPVIAPYEGVVVYAGMDNTGFGNRVGVYNPKTNRTTYLSHLSDIGVKQGQNISRGYKLGTTGGRPNTYGAGNTTGEHLDITEYEGNKVFAPTLSANTNKIRQAPTRRLNPANFKSRLALNLLKRMFG